MGNVYSKGDFAVCPHCDEEQEKRVEEYFDGDESPDSPESVVEEQCWMCDDFFFISLLEDEEYEITDSERKVLDLEDGEDDF